MYRRSNFVLYAAIAAGTALAVRAGMIMNDPKVTEAAAHSGSYSISGICEYAGIYDCNGEKLNNLSHEYYAVIKPGDESSLKALPYVTDIERYKVGIKGNLPFLCKVSEEKIEGVPVIFSSAVRTDENQTARHIIGYRANGSGACGIEYAYDDLISSNYSENKAVYSVNAVGSIMEGLASDEKYGSQIKAGVMLTLDKKIQQICEKAMTNNSCKKGAVIVMDVKTGEIKACASMPLYSLTDLESSLSDEDAPFINRVFSAYSVGSIFKLVTASAALELGISPELSYVCDGSVNVNGQLFNCHKWGGHGELDMNEAVVQSCNPYFISLGEYIGSEFFIDTASAYGFGEKTTLCKGMTSASGYLPSVRELSVRAEKGNFSFGQGKLTATPLQICRMTAAIANDGVLPQPKLVIGTLNSEGMTDKIAYPEGERVISPSTAAKLREFMVNTMNTKNSCSRSYIVSGGGKTSTAQTGRFSSDGNELMNCWFTGYFPSDKPKYAVTVLAEEGFSGNMSAAPVYKEISEKVTLYEKAKRR